MSFLLVNGGTAVSDSARTDCMFGSGIGTQMSSDPAYENDMPEFDYIERELEMEAFMQLCESICGMPLDTAKTKTDGSKLLSLPNSGSRNSTSI